MSLWHVEICFYLRFRRRIIAEESYTAPDSNKLNFKTLYLYTYTSGKKQVNGRGIAYYYCKDLVWCFLYNETNWTVKLVLHVRSLKEKKNNFIPLTAILIKI